ncbi:MAG: hypothetical protein DWQ36_16010 [Acidobacteria bacterium]|nr:MAG: hypothetical protein DWQ30_20415 [Acidobacteriota bacterium]REK05615.1 MAG: hypothetical protein DWQ36_16010 [Acidobacteriota bacterium]
MGRLIYFTIEDEGMLAEAFSNLDSDTIAIAYKVLGTEDVFVAPGETKDALDRQDVHLNLLAEEDAAKISVYHSPLSREELADYEDALKALSLACHGIAIACVGVNGESDLGFDLSNGTENYTYFTAPAGHTFIFRVFTKRDEARDFLDRLTIGDQRAMDWVDSLPIDSAEELVSYH